MALPTSSSNPWISSPNWQLWCQNPEINLTRFHGVFAPNSKHRVQVTPAGRGKGNKTKSPDGTEDHSPFEQRVSMNWAQRLKRVFNIDIETCSECGGAVKIIACIEDPVVYQEDTHGPEGKNYRSCGHVAGGTGSATDKACSIDSKNCFPIQSVGNLKDTGGCRLA